MWSIYPGGCRDLLGRVEGLEIHAKYRRHRGRLRTAVILAANLIENRDHAQFVESLGLGQVRNGGVKRDLWRIEIHDSLPGGTIQDVVRRPLLRVGSVSALGSADHFEDRVHP